MGGHDRLSLEMLMKHAPTRKALRKRLTPRVAEWIWAKGHLLELEPLYAEFQGHAPAKPLLAKPEKTRGCSRYGLDRDGRLVLAEYYVDDEGTCAERFVEAIEGNELVRWHFRATSLDGKRPVAVSVIGFERARVRHVWTLDERNATEHRYAWVDGQVVEIARIDLDGVRPPVRYVVTYEEGTAVAIDAVLHDGEVLAKYRRERPSLKTLLAEARALLVREFRRVAEAATGPVAIVVPYSLEDPWALLPESLFVLTPELVAALGKETSSPEELLWAEFLDEHHVPEVALEGAMGRRLRSDIAQAVTSPRRAQRVLKMIVAVCRDVTGSTGIPFVPSDYEQTNMRANLEGVLGKKGRKQLSKHLNAIRASPGRKERQRGAHRDRGTGD